MNLKEYIVDSANKIGIDMIGFSDTNPFLEIRNHLIDRKNKGYYTEFEYEDIDLRTMPKLHLNDAKSIIAIALSYNIDLKEKRDYKFKGVLSKSSWGIDYHRILFEKLEKLASEISKIKDFNYKVFVDTGPLIDRYVAKKSGIGWFGKNCSIINDEFGSFIFLGYMITDIEIENDKSVQEKCGSCSLCIDACPTHAIRNNYYIDTSRCISYLTQTKNNISYELREKMNNKIYGCDVCQAVCPKNKDIKTSNNNEFYPNVTLGSIDIEELLIISNKNFKKKYGHISGSWRGKNVLKRNGIISLGNMNNKDAIDLLKKSLYDNNPMIRKYSLWSLFRLDKELAFKLLEEFQKEENDEEVISEIKKIILYFEED